MGAAPDSAHLLALDRAAATSALLDGSVQIVMMVAPWDSPFVQQLLQADSVHLAAYPRGPAYEALHPELIVLDASARRRGPAT